MDHGNVNIIANIISKKCKIEIIPLSELQKKERLLKIKVSVPCDFFKITKKIEKQNNGI